MKAIITFQEASRERSNKPLEIATLTAQTRLTRELNNLINRF